MTTTSAAAPEIVFNPDVRGIHSRMNDFIIEMNRSGSGSSSHFSAFDVKRLASYLDSLDGYVAWVVSMPQLDLPKIHPREYPLEPNPVIVDIDNQDALDVVRMLLVARDELTNSNSARQSSGLIVYDQERFTAIIARVRAFLNDYIGKVNPLDLPESSPERAIAPAGQRGVSGASVTDPGSVPQQNTVSPV